jgi:hypothetical protein
MNNMDLFSYLTLALPDLSPYRCHVHFASKNNYDEDPLTEFEHGTFDEWQCWQKKKVFSRPYVVSLIQTENKLRWMYAGTYETGELPLDTEPVSGRDEAYYRYALTPVAALSEYAGRLHVTRAPAANARVFVRRGRLWPRIWRSPTSPLPVAPWGAFRVTGRCALTCGPSD